MPFGKKVFFLILQQFVIWRDFRNLFLEVGFIEIVTYNYYYYYYFYYCLVSFSCCGA
jgi:hypothetical protein